MTDTATMLALGEDYPELREAVRQICERFPGAYWRKLEEEQAYPTAFIAELTQGGFLASLIPEEYGGSGLPLRAAAVILEEINAAGCTASQGHAQMYIMGTLLRHGSEEQKQRYLPKIASGELRLQAFGVTEPTTGSDTTKLKTRAVRQGNALHRQRPEGVDLARAALRPDAAAGAHDAGRGGEAAQRRASVFLVDLRESLGQGVEIRPIEAMINHNTTEVFFDNLEVPAENLIGEEGQGVPLHPRRHERRAHPDRAGMHRRRALVAQNGVDYAKERVVFDRPIGQNQGVQFPIARAYAEIEAADLICRRAAALFDAGKECGADANMAKLLASEATWHAAEAALQTHGGFAFAREYDIERKWRETRLYQTAPISTNLILAYIGEHVLGMPRSY